MRYTFVVDRLRRACCAVRLAEVAGKATCLQAVEPTSRACVREVCRRSRNLAMLPDPSRSGLDVAASGIYPYVGGG